MRASNGVKERIKAGILELSYDLGVFRLARLLRRRQPIILLFHRFTNDSEGDPTGVPIEHFEQCMHYLSRHYRVVALQTIVEELTRGTVRPYTAAVTIDDGYEEVFSLAAPVFRKYGVPATIFVVSGMIDGRSWLWPDRFRFVFSQAPCGRLEFKHRGATHTLEIRSRDEAGKAEDHWLTYALRSPVTERDELLEAIAHACRVEIPPSPPKQYKPMAWEQLRVLASEGFDVGAHTKTHPILSRIDPRQLRKEIADCKEQIERNVGVSVRHFAYPNGQKEDYTPEVVEAVSRAGYAAAVTAVPGFNTPATSRFELHRICPSSEDVAHFAQSVSGIDLARRRLRGGVSRE